MYRTQISNMGGYAFKVKAKGGEFDVDMHGSAGVTPPDVLLASIGSCIGVYIRKYVDGAKLTLPEFEVTVEAEFTKEPPACFKQINVSVDLKGATLDERRRKAILEFAKNCPVHNTLKGNPEINIVLDNHRTYGIV